MTDDEKIALVERFLRLYGEGRWADPHNTDPLERLLAMLADDVDWWVAGMGKVTKPAFRSALATIADRTDGPLVITPTGWTIAGDRVAVEAQSTMKLQSGRDYRNRYHFLFGLRGDKIAVYHEYHDTAHVADVLFGHEETGGAG